MNSNARIDDRDADVRCAISADCPRCDTLSRGQPQNIEQSTGTRAAVAMGMDRRALVVPIAVVLTSAPASARYSSASPRGPAMHCELRDCGLPLGAVVFGGASAGYTAAWVFARDELSAPVHVAGLAAGGLSMATALGYAVADTSPPPRFRAFAGISCLLVGAPALLLGIHGLIAEDEQREAKKPSTPPKWYGPSYMVDARGRFSPALVAFGTF
jgi:hypothetical protein